MIRIGACEPPGGDVMTSPPTEGGLNWSKRKPPGSIRETLLAKGWSFKSGRIMKAAAEPVGEPWLWTLAFGQHEDRTPTHGYKPTRKARNGGVFDFRSANPPPCN